MNSSKQKRKEKGISHVQEPVQLTQRGNFHEGTIRAMRSLNRCVLSPLPTKSEVKLLYQTVSFIGVPDLHEEESGLVFSGGECDRNRVLKA